MSWLQDHGDKLPLDCSVQAHPSHSARWSYNHLTVIVSVNFTTLAPFLAPEFLDRSGRWSLSSPLSGNEDEWQILADDHLVAISTRYPVAKGTTISLFIWFIRDLFHWSPAGSASHTPNHQMLPKWKLSSWLRQFEVRSRMGKREQGESLGANFKTLGPRQIQRNIQPGEQRHIFGGRHIQAPLLSLKQTATPGALFGTSSSDVNMTVRCLLDHRWYWCTSSSTTLKGIFCMSMVTGMLLFNKFSLAKISPWWKEN